MFVDMNDGDESSGQQLELQHDSFLAPIGTETRAQLKRTEDRLRKERNEARLECEWMATELRMLRHQAAQAQTERLQQEEGEGRRTNGDFVGTADEGEQPDEGQRNGTLPTRNLVQQAASLATFDGDKLKEAATTIVDWFEEFDTLAILYHWSPQEELVALVSKLKGAALSVYRAASAEEKRSCAAIRRELITQFQPVRIQAIQNNMFRRRTQRQNETVGAYYRDLRELYRRAFPNWARNKDPDGEEVLRGAFVAGLRLDIQRKLTVDEQELDLRSTFSRAQYIEATFREAPSKAKGSGSSTYSSTSTLRQLKKCYNCGKPGHISKECRARKDQAPDRGKKTPVSQAVTCFKCKKAGHYARECPEKATYGNQAGVHTAKQLVRAGKINGCPANRIHIDTGSSMTLVNRRFVPMAADSGSVQMRNTTGTQHYPTATVTIELDGLTHHQTVAVSDQLLEDAFGLI